MRIVRDLKDVQIVLNELLDWKQLLESKANDMHGLQIKNVGDGTDDDDVVTVGQLEVEVEKLKRLLVDVNDKINKINKEITKIWVEIP
jgi:hypothetical protein